VNARLHFVGKSDDPYHTELVSAAETLAISDFVVFTNYVTRQVYLDNLASADVVVQLRYPIFGQVSGPLADAVACGTPVVTTEELAVGMDLGHRCVMIPNRFSPLHIAEGIRQIFEAHDISKNRHFNSMGNYTSRLIQIYEMMVDENYIASSSSAPGDQKLSELKNKSIEPKEAKRKRRGKKPGLENSMFDHSVD
jgi:glycosyltransferase involved in cell wall biosynthesis